MKTKINVCSTRWVLLSALAVLALHSLSAAIGQERGQTVRLRIGAATAGQEIELYGGSYALVIGVSDYPKGWRDLPGVREDMPAVKAALEKHGFKVTTALNPTRRQFDDAVDQFIGAYGQRRDNRLLIYFAGHGHTIKTQDGRRQLGYIVPADAPFPKASDTGEFKRLAVSMNEINNYAEQMEAVHVLFVFDSCFAGTIFKSRSGGVPEAITDKIVKPVRQFITAGSEKQTVPDYSFFRRAFVAALDGAGDDNRDGFITGAELGEYLHREVSNYTKRAQTPEHGKTSNPDLNEGDLVFVAGLSGQNPAPQVASVPLSSQTTAPKDTIAPKIVITSPPVTRGVGPRSTAGRIPIKGQALDDSGVREVVAQGVAARLDAQGNFSAEVPLVTGDNRITVTATDVHGNQATENFSIRRDPELTAPSGKYVALLIGNNAYQHLGALKTAVNDAEKVAGLLRESYGFETKALLNATREKIITAINDYRRSLTDQDHLVIYYAGHGFFDRDVNKAYWLPVDARETDNANWISADDVTTNIRGIRARHVLIISDSCYSGTIVRETSLRLTTPAERERYLEKMMQGTSRILMASGGNEPVEDGGGGGHSVFANALLRGLRQMDAPVFTAEELFFRFVKEPVAGKSDQTPEYSPLRNSGHESGGFVFVRRK